MSDKVKLDIELSIPDSALAQAKSQLDKLGRQVDQDTKARGSAQTQGGKNSFNYLVTDKELRTSMQAHSKASAHALRELRNFELKSRSMGQKVKGALHWALYGGEKDETSESAEQRSNRQLTQFHNKLRNTAVLVSSVMHSLAPVPGGGIIASGASGMAQGFSEGLIDPKTGRARGGLSGVASGVWGGVKGLGIGTALSGLAAGVSGAVQGGREDEHIRYMLSQQAGGDVGVGRGIYGAVRRSGMTQEEAAPLGGMAARIGGGAGTAQSALRAQLIGGNGQDLLESLSTLSKSGSFSGSNQTAQMDASSKKMWSDVMSAGIAQGLPKARWSEIWKSANSVMSNRNFGVKADFGAATGLLKWLGQGTPAFQGEGGGQAAAGLEGMARGGTPLSRGLGFARHMGKGQSFYGATRTMEKGLAGMGPEGVTEMVNQFLKMSGGNKDQASYLMSQNGMGTMAASDLLIDRVRSSGGVTQGDITEASQKGKTPEQEAWDAMKESKGFWSSVDQKLSDIRTAADGLFTELGGKDGIKELLKLATTVLRELHDLLKDFKQGGVAGMLTGGLQRNTTKDDRFTAPYVDLPGTLIPRGSTDEADAMRQLFKSIPPDVVDKATRDLGGKMGGTGATRVQPSATRDEAGHLHLVITMERSNGEIIAEREVFARTSSAPAQKPKTFVPMVR